MDVLRMCKRTWWRLGVPRETAAEMAAELEADLAAAIAGGHSAQDYVGPDPQAFAVEWARARGLAQARLRLATTTVAALLGALPGAVFALFAAYGLSSQAIGDIFGAPVRVGENAYQNRFDAPLWLVLTLYSLGAVFAYAGALASVLALLSWRLDPARARTRKLLALALPFGIGSALAVTVLFAASQSFATTANVVLSDVVVAVVVFSLFVAGLRVLAIRREREEGPPAETLFVTGA